MVSRRGRYSRLGGVSMIEKEKKAYWIFFLRKLYLFLNQDSLFVRKGKYWYWIEVLLSMDVAVAR